MLTDCYAQASCTAGRAAFITGQIPLRTGLTTVGLPGAPLGLQAEDPTLAELIKPQGYLTAQIGKTTWVTATSSSRQSMGLTSSTATSITSTPRRNPSSPTTPRTARSSRNCSLYAGCSTVRPATSTTTPRTRASVASESRRSSTPGR